MGGAESFSIDLAPRVASHTAVAGDARGHAPDHGGHAHGRTTPAGPQNLGAKASEQAAQVSSPPTPRVIDILRRYTPNLLTRLRVAQQSKNVLARILLCRTATLKGRLYECPTCQSQCHIYNSCVDRHCPQCGGARRANWLEKTEQLILPQINYFQVIFTLPDQLSGLILGNRRALYDLLFQASWQALDDTLRKTGRFQPAAQLVLHTWNQRLDHHPHIHALVPGGGPSLDGEHWTTSHHPTQPRRRKPFLVDNIELGRSFRKHFVDGIRRLVCRGKLRLEGAWQTLQDPTQREVWLDELCVTDWNVFVEGPPHGRSQPTDVLKYLAAYMSGGPISNGRMISDEDGVVTFWARSKDKAGGNRPEPFSLKGTEFVRRWTMHILPQGFMRSRSYGGYHSTKRAAYLDTCRQLLGLTDDGPPSGEDRPEEPKPSGPKCPQCETVMECIQEQSRPSWKQVFERGIYADPQIYCPLLHICQRVPQAYPLDEYG
jgi:hypothetical protein